MEATCPHCKSAKVEFEKAKGAFKCWECGKDNFKPVMVQRSIKTEAIAKATDTLGGNAKVLMCPICLKEQPVTDTAKGTDTVEYTLQCGHAFKITGIKTLKATKIGSG